MCLANSLLMSTVTDLQASTKLVEGVSRVQVVGVCARLQGVGRPVSITSSLGRGSYGGGSLYWRHGLPHTHVCPISKCLDSITYGHNRDITQV